MKNNNLYIQLKTIAANYTVEQVELATYSQVCNLFGVKVSEAFFRNMKSVLIRELRSRDDEVDLQNFRSAASTFLDANFPNWETEKGCENGKPFIKIWLNGRGE